jgi:hypothetical protein
VDFSTISLQNKRFNILQNCFQANKPAYLLLPPKKPHDQDLEGGEENPKEGKKKPKFNKDGDKDK